MSYRIKAGNAAVVVQNGTLQPADAPAALEVSLPAHTLRPGLINAHDHLHRNHFPRLGAPPYTDAYAWGRDLHARFSADIENARRLDRRTALLFGALKNIASGVTCVVHHDAWEPDFDAEFPVRVARVAHAHSLRFESNLDGILQQRGDAAFCIHLAEGTTDADADEVRELAERGGVDHNLIAVHCVGVDPDGIERLAAAEAAVVACPTSNQFLFGRTLPAALASRLDLLVGSDSLLTADGTLLDELRAARGLGLADEARLLDAVGSTAARRLRLPMPTLEANNQADFICLSKPIFEATVRDVALVVVNGEPRFGDFSLHKLFEYCAVDVQPLHVCGVDKLVIAPLADAAAAVAALTPDALRVFSR